MRIPEGATKEFYRSGPNNPRFTWNKAVLDFLNTGNDWLFSTHNDVKFHPDTLLRLLSWNKPLVSGLIFMRQSPVLPHVWKAYDDPARHYTMRINDTREWFMDHKEYIKFDAFVMEPRPDDALVQVDFTSTSCTLVHRSVLEDMRVLVEEKWFVCDDDVNGGGEDRRFFQYAKAAGYTGYVDRSCVCGHLIGDIPTSSADFIMWDSVSDWRDTGEPVAELPELINA